MNPQQARLEMIGLNFDEACATARLTFVKQMEASGWTAEEARAAFTLNDMDPEEARARLISEADAWLKGEAD